MEETKQYCKIQESDNKSQGESNRELKFITEHIIDYKNCYTDPHACKNLNVNEFCGQTELKFGILMHKEFKELQIKHEVNEHEEVVDNDVEKLSSELQFTFRDDTAENFHENEQICETKLKFGNCMETGSYGFNMKQEEIDIKAEDEEATRRQDSTLISKDASAVAVYQCHLCVFETVHKRSLKRHMFTHKVVPEKTYLCGICTYKTNRKGNLTQHMLIHKDTSEITMYQCDTCTLKTRYKNHLKAHMLVHKNASELTMYSCVLCAYKTKRKNSLKKHMLIHKDISEVTTYQCDLCSYNTRHKHRLMPHMLIHKTASELTLYSCGICTYKAKRKDLLKRHMLTHKSASEITMYSCEICTYKARQKGNLQRHMLLIHKKPF